MGDSIRSGRNASNPFGITKANVRPLLVGATVLNMKDCQEACVAFIRELLTVQNCMTYFIFSIDKCLRDLRVAVIPFLLNHIEEIQDRAEFRNLTFGKINYLMPSPSPTSPNEEGSASGDLVESEPLLSKLLFSFFKWWEVYREGRFKDFTTMSRKFPLTRVDAEVLRKIYRGNDMLRYDPTCKSLYLETIESKFFAERSKSNGENSSVATHRSSTSNECSQITEVAEGAHEAERVVVNVQCVNSINKNQEQREELRENQSICSAPDVGVRNSEEGQSCVVSGEDVTTGSNPRKEQSSDDHPHAQLDVGVTETRGNCVGIGQNGGDEDAGQQVVQICGERSVRSDAEFSVQTPGGSRGQKRPAQDDDVELLGVVPIKRNVIAEVDLTVDDTGADVSSSNASASSPKPTLYFVSGSKQKNLMELDMTDFLTRKVAGFPFKGNSIHLLYNAGKIYTICSKIINSNGEEERTRSVRFLDLKKKVWVHAPKLKMKRHNFAWTVVDDCIYVFGGMKSSRRSGFVEKLCSSIGRWELVQSEPMVRRSYHTACQMSGSIYLVGGCWLNPLLKKHVAKAWRTATYMEVYKPSQCDQKVHRGGWAVCSQLPEIRIGHCVAAVDTSLYVIGGRLTLSPESSETTCLVYCLRTREWEDVAPLLQARQNFSAFVIERHIYVVGGNEGPPTMEKYDVDRDMWTLV